MNLPCEDEIRLNIERTCKSLTEKEKICLGDSIIENYELMKRLAKL